MQSSVPRLPSLVLHGPRSSAPSSYTKRWLAGRRLEMPQRSAPQLAEITTPPPPPLLRFGLRTAPVNLHMPFPGSHGIKPLTTQNRSSSHFLLTPYSTHASCPSERRTSGMAIIAKRLSHSQTRPLHSLAPLAPAENRHRASSLGTKAITCTNPFLTPRPSTGTREENSSPSLRGAVHVLRASPQPLPSLAKPCVRA